MESPQEDLLKLRRRVKDLMGLGYLGEGAGTYEQTILQAWQEAERRRIALRQKAETLRLQAAAADAEASAFTVMGSILYNIVNGFVEAGMKRQAEDAERDRERAEAERVEAETTKSPKAKRKKDA